MPLVVTGVGGAAGGSTAETMCCFFGEAGRIVVSAAFRFRVEGGMVAAGLQAQRRGSFHVHDSKGVGIARERQCWLSQFQHDQARCGSGSGSLASTEVHDGEGTSGGDGAVEATAVGRKESS